MENKDNEKNKNEGKEFGVFLNLKTRLKPTNEIFDYGNAENTTYVRDMNTFLTFLKKKRYNLYRLRNNDIVKADQGNVTKEDEFLILIRKGKDYYYIDNLNYSINCDSNSLALDKFRATKNFIWKVVNSEPSTKLKNPNEDHYLKQWDIIKLGKVKYLVSKICIINEKKEDNDNKGNSDNKGNNEKKDDKENKGNNENNENKENNEKKGNNENKGNKENNDNKGNNKNTETYEIDEDNIFTIEIKEFKKCEFCNENIYSFCKCNNEFQHTKCIQKWIDERKYDKDNKKKTVNNHFIDVYFCDEVIKKDPNCDDPDSRDCECVRCNTFYPLRFKYKEGKEESKNFFKIPIKFKNKSYMILESFETNDESKNIARYRKYIHVIQLTDDDINIGRGMHNDVIIEHSSVCKEHAVIRYNKKDGKILLKNKSKKAGTLVLIKQKEVILSEKEVHLQINKTFIQAKIMEEKDYLKIKNDNSKYPLPDLKSTNEK